jgi:hypothetical protein
MPLEGHGFLGGDVEIHIQKSSFTTSKYKGIAIKNRPWKKAGRFLLFIYIPKA